MNRGLFQRMGMDQVPFIFANNVLNLRWEKWKEEKEEYD
jgi:hypothetical protein